jgi:hypothetical protein
MNHRLFRVGTLAAISAVAAAVLAATSLVNAAAAVKPDSCPTDKPLVVDSYFTVWALDAGTRFIRIWSLGGNASCLRIHDIGNFTTFAGVSPEGTGTVPGGLTGTFQVTVYDRLYGIFAPTAPTTGFLGNFDIQCQHDGTCGGSIPSIHGFYFPAGYRYLDYGAFNATYDGGTCGRWTQTNSGDFGDIVC